MKSEKKFNWRAFTTVYILLSIIIIFISGIVLYIAPPGRVAHWTELRIIGFTKEQWQALHTIFTFIFILSIGFHLYFNWKPLVAYLRTKMNEKLNVRKEFVTAFLVFIVIFVFILYEVPPFSAVMDVGEQFSEMWSDDNTEPPVPHAEQFSLTECSDFFQVPLRQIHDSLSSHNIKFDDPKITIEELAQLHYLTPQKLFGLMGIDNSPLLGKTAEIGSGYGRKTVAEICIQVNLPLEVVLKRLKDKGINAEPDSKIRDIASDYNKLPIDIIKIINPDASQ